MNIKNGCQEFEFNIIGYEFDIPTDEWEDWYKMHFLIRKNGETVADETCCCVLAGQMAKLEGELEALRKGELTECASDELWEPYFSFTAARETDGRYMINAAFQTDKAADDTQDITISACLAANEFSSFVGELKEQIRRYPLRADAHYRRLLAEASQEFLALHSVKRVRMKKVSGMTEDELIHTCEKYCERKNLTDQFITFLGNKKKEKRNRYSL